MAGEDIPSDEEYICLRKDGSPFWVEKRSFLINWGGDTAVCSIRADIDNRRKAEEALRESEERFRTLFNTSPQGILVHREHKPLFANAALAEMYGYKSPEEIINLDTTYNLIAPSSRTQIGDSAFLETQDSIDKEYRGLKKSGEEFWVMKRSFAINWDGERALCSMRTDISERKKAEETIRRSEEQFRIAITGLQEGFALYDSNDSLVIYNDEFVRLHPGAKDVIRPGMKWLELLEATLKSGMNAQAVGRENEYREERLREFRNPSGPKIRHNINGTWRIVNEAKLPDGGTVAIQTYITELKKLESEALTAQSQLLAAIESIEGGFSLYGPDGRLVLSNSNNQIYFNDISDLYKPGIKFEDILLARADRGLIDGIEGSINAWVKDRLKRFNERKPSVHLRKNGNRWMQINEYPTSDGGKAIIRTDITDSKTMTDALLESEERFKTLVDSSIQGILIHRNNKPLYANSALAKMLGYKSPQNILDLSSIKKLLKPAKKTNGQLNTALSSGSDELLTAMQDGTPIWVSNTDFEIDWEGQTCTCTTLFDITERKTAETQLVQASKLASLGELASSVAHELNQPLSITRIVAESTMMKTEEGTIDTDYLQKQLSAICDQSERMANITNHLRMFSRLDEGEVSLFNPAESLNNAYELIEQPFLLSGIKLTKRTSKEPLAVLGSGFKLEQVILNLLNNAADAVNDQMERMEGANKKYTPRISVSLSAGKKNRNVIIRVRDNGGGIDQSHIDKIFDPFFTTKQAEHGTGLGLSISYGIVKSMQGLLTVSNDKNGALFSISLPAQPKAHKPAKTKPQSKNSNRRSIASNGNGKSKHNGNGKGNGDGRHVLVVDDEQLAADSIAEHLEHFGYKVKTANNGAEALMICDDTPPDIVITDLRMPVMNGFELIRELRTLHPKLPIIVTTGHANLEEEEEAVTDGASAVLWKPIRLAELTTKLTELVN